MVAPILPDALTPLSWLKCSLPDDRELGALPVKAGEPCFAILLYRPPKRSKWRPRTPDAIPPMHLGTQTIFFPRRVLAPVVKDCLEFNQHTLLRLKPGRRVPLWAIPVSLIAGFDETAKVIGGAL